MKEWFPAAELAGLPGLPTTDRRVRDVANRNSWKARRRQTGKGFEYHISSLPLDARAQLGARQNRLQRCESVDAQAGGVAGRRLAIADTMQKRRSQLAREQGLNGYLKLNENGRSRADARVAILAELKTFGQNSALSGRRAVDAFAAKYNLGEIEVADWVREQVETVAAATLYRWQKRYKDEGVTALAGNYKGQAGRSLIDRQPDLKTFVVSMLSDYPHTTGTHVMKAATARFAGTDIELPSKRRMEVWISNWKRENKSLYTAVTNPDAWKNKFMVAFGSYSEDVTRLNQRWELDSTPADVMLLDGRYSVIGAIDIYSRRLKLLVSRTSKASSVGQLLRRCFIDWGIPEEIKTDNGADYTSRYIKNVIESLEIDQQLCNPFSGWEKPHMERVFHTFAHDLVELLPGYIGHNVSERSAIESRRSFADRLFQKDPDVQLRMTAQEFQEFADNWVENIYMHQHHEKLNDTPFNRVAKWAEPVRKISDERALDVLLAGAPDTTTRSVTKKGLRIDGIHYIAPELGSVVGEQVRVAYTESVGAVYVFTDDGFLCVAEAPEYTGIDRKEVAAHAKVAQREAIQAKRRELRAAARRVNTKGAADEILAHARQQHNVTTLPPRSETHTTEALEQATRAADAATTKPVSSRNDETRQAVEDLRANLAAPRKAAVVEMGTNPKADYRRWMALDRKARAGEMLNQQEKAFYEGYPKTTDYSAMKDFFKRFGLEAKEG
ncbi:MAG TPA: hypothetical protein DCS18_16430 [Alcanivorax sp.]|nr:hypothetical protein [Alcanivorax sp.]HAV68681.1 hypothetical protein [Alcanivorax sp.]|tara:strand:- start:76774 stop:78951 length:2178 start_codon:yes stop_codon:yes gene_type:complete